MSDFDVFWGVVNFRPHVHGGCQHITRLFLVPMHWYYVSTKFAGGFVYFTKKIKLSPPPTGVALFYVYSLCRALLNDKMCPYKWIIGCKRDITLLGTQYHKPERIDFSIRTSHDGVMCGAVGMK